ncbi:DUF5671 domain-containing protein [Paracoccus spongiarum]|uniref:DUF5671 domain-containing protein n=1 Tax=Paracoccus spongiarum TaxID=3064387 RepID=A0ABT9J7M4_9RHOB|nr:DUF5671 domain-containing protein [Paracoccus sp. 2205BS29-5]MDP5305812.1 DUF5671 domain-containing protein [Paracoccus sp. 2205BS29-5]
MTDTGDLSQFIRAALAAGRERTAIAEALAEAGWSPREIQGGLAGWHDSAGMPPVPRARPYVSAREAMLHALLLVALSVVCWYTVNLGFGLIDVLLPDETASLPWHARMRSGVAILAAFLPALLVLDNRLARRFSDDQLRRRSRARRGFAAATVLISALVLLGDLAASIHALLSGDLTARFLAKALLVALTGVLVLIYYKADLDG